MSAKKREDTNVPDQQEEQKDNVNPFVPQLDETTVLDLSELLDDYKSKASKSQEDEGKTAERIAKNKASLIRIQANIARLMEKTSTFSGRAWDESVISPIVKLLRDIYPAAAIEKSVGMGCATTITITRKNIKAADKLRGIDTKAITLVPVGDFELGIRDYSTSTNEFPPGSVGFMQGLNFPVRQIPNDNALGIILEYLK